VAASRHRRAGRDASILQAWSAAAALNGRRVAWAAGRETADNLRNAAPAAAAKRGSSSNAHGGGGKRA